MKALLSPSHRIQKAAVLLTAAFGFACLALSSAAEDETQAAQVLRPAETSSPRQTLRSFIDACNEIYFLIQRENREGLPRDHEAHQRIVNRIFSCLDLSEEPEFIRQERGELAAVCLKEVLDRIVLPPLEEIPGPGEVAKTGEEAGLKEWRIPQTTITVALMEAGPREGDYLFSAETVSRAVDYYKQVQHLPYRPGSSSRFYEWFLSDPGPWLTTLVGWLPDWFRTTFWGSHAAWQWFGLVFALGGGLMLMMAFYAIGRRRAKTVKDRSVIGYCLTLAFPILAMLIPLFLSDFVPKQLRLSGSVLTTVTFSASVIFLLAAMLVIVGAGSRLAEIFISSPKIHTKGLDAQLIRIVCRVVSLAAATVVFLEGGKYLGIPVTTLLASAGVGGLALALAAQDSLKNFFGSMMIILDRPFRVGERIVVREYDGVVEEIGLRSTKLRLLNGHQAIVPNEEMARSDIENIGRRPHIRRVLDLRIPLDTPPEKVERAVSIAKITLKDHEGMDDAYPPRVSLNEINDDSFNIRLFYWYHPPDYWDFFAHSQRVNLEIQRRFNEEGIAFAPPTSVMHVSPPGDTKAADATEIPGSAGA